MGERDKDNVVDYDMGSDSELRFEIESKSEKVIVELKSGYAELFGEC
jgi:polyribonucleotide 5'-hydroxyl-kinase